MGGSVAGHQRPRFPMQYKFFISVILFYEKLFFLDKPYNTKLLFLE